MMVVLLANLRRWWHSRDRTREGDLGALAGKWPDNAHWMARFANPTRDPGPLGCNGGQLAATSKCDVERGR